jgi:uncharacterized protein involved in exopolysaccharide biosynthesis
MSDQVSREVQAAHLPQVTADYVHFDVVAYVRELWRAKFLIAGLALLLAAVSFAVSYARPKTYRAELRFMPPQRTSSIPFVLPRGSSGDEYRALLNSDRVGNDVVEHLHLTDFFQVKDKDLAAAILRGSSKFTIDANNFITITAITNDPHESALIANEYYAALSRLETGISKEEAVHRLNFMSGPLEVERERLNKAEEDLRAAQQKTGLVLPQAQGSLGIQQIASLRNRLLDLQSQLSTALVSQTSESPRVVTLNTQIGNVQSQIEKLERSSNQADSPARLPEMGLEVLRREREVQFHLVTLEAISRSMQVSQLQDSYSPGFPLIDAAVQPKYKYSPSRKLWAICGFMAGFFIAFLYVLFRTTARIWSATPDGVATIARWKKTWREDLPGNAYGR